MKRKSEPQLAAGFRLPLLATLPAVFALLLAPFASAADSPAPGAKGDKDVEPVRVRFVCAASIRPLKFRPGPNGIMEVYYEEGEAPPDQIFYKDKDGKTYRRVSLATNAEPAQCVVSADKRGATPSVFFTRKVVSTKDAGKQPKTSVEYDPLVTVNGLGGKLKDALVCLYNPDPVAHWCPPKTLVLDVSVEAVPAGAVRVVNLSRKAVALQIGAARPLTLKPGANETVAPGPAKSGQIEFKLAAAKKGGPLSIIADNAYDSPAGSRQVLVIYSVNERLNPQGVDWFVGNL